MASRTNTITHSWPVERYTYARVQSTEGPLKEKVLWGGVGDSNKNVLLDIAKSPSQALPTFRLRVTGTVDDRTENEITYVDLDLTYYSTLKAAGKDPLKAAYRDSVVSFRYMDVTKTNSPVSPQVQGYRRFQLTLTSPAHVSELIGHIACVCPCKVAPTKKDAPNQHPLAHMQTQAFSHSVSDVRAPSINIPSLSGIPQGSGSHSATQHEVINTESASYPLLDTTINRSLSRIILPTSGDQTFSRPPFPCPSSSSLQHTTSPTRGAPRNQQTWQGQALIPSAEEWALDMHSKLNPETASALQDLRVNLRRMDRSVVAHLPPADGVRDSIGHRQLAQLHTSQAFGGSSQVPLAQTRVDRIHTDRDSFNYHRLDNTDATVQTGSHASPTHEARSSPVPPDAGQQSQAEIYEHPVLYNLPNDQLEALVAKVIREPSFVEFMGRMRGLWQAKQLFR